METRTTETLGPVTRVLLVEDNPGDARLVRLALSEISAQLPVDVKHVERLRDALSALENEPFGAILLDLSLPDSRNLEGIRTIRQHTPGVPVIILTGLDDEVMAMQAIEAGAQDYLVKGHFDSNLLERAIRYAMERQRIVEQLQQREGEAHRAAAVAQEKSEQLVVALQSLLQEITRREKAEALLRAEGSLGEMLRAVSAAANEAHSAAHAVLSTVRLVCRYLDWPVGRCYVPPETRPIVPTGIWHIQRSGFTAFREFWENASAESACCLSAAVIADREVSWLSDIRKESYFADVKEDLRVRSALAFPVFIDKKAVAVLEFFTDQVTEPEQWLIAELPQIGIQLGRVIERERAERALRESEDRYRDLVESSDDLICTHDLNGDILSANRAMIRVLTGDPDSNLTGRNLTEFVTPDVRHAVAEYLATIRAQPEAHGLMKIQTSTGQVRILEYRNTRRVDGASPIVRARARDITERFFAQRALSRSERRYRLLFERNLAGICRATVTGEVLDCNDALSRLLGYEDTETLMRSGRILLPVNSEWDSIVDRLAEEGFLSNIELCLARRDGSLIWLLANLSYMTGDRGDPPSVEAICIDITNRKIGEEEVAYQAHHDPVTRLPNRYLLRERFSHALADRRTSAQGLALLYVDLDGFKAVNDALGHDAGDRVLREVASRLINQVRSSDTVARIGGDEFAILLSGVNSDDIIAKIGQKLVDCVRAPFRHDLREYDLSASIGIAVAPRDGRDEQTLIRKADEAMYMAKVSGKNRFRFFTSDQPAASEQAKS